MLDRVPTTSVGANRRCPGRLWVTMAAVLICLACAACGSTSGTSLPAKHATYQLHMAFFSHESGLGAVIDPQVFVSRPGAAGGVGPQMITHAAGLTPAPGNAPAGTPLLGATGRSLHITFGEWQRARGSLTFSCTKSVSTVSSRLTGLIPRGVYSVFVVHLKVNGPRRFTPLGSASGSDNTFVASATGTAEPRDSVVGCLTKADAVVVIWHSDGMSHGSAPGVLGVTWHNSVITPVP